MYILYLLGKFILYNFGEKMNKEVNERGGFEKWFKKRYYKYEFEFGKEDLKEAFLAGEKMEKLNEVKKEIKKKLRVKNWTQRCEKVWWHMSHEGDYDISHYAIQYSSQPPKAKKYWKIGRVYKNGHYVSLYLIMRLR